MKIVYIAGPYSGPRQESNISAASDAAAILWTKGIPCICPHLNTRNFDGFNTWSMFMQGYLEILRRCDIVFMISGWEKSAGAREEHAEAIRIGIPIVYSYHQLYICIDNYEDSKKVSELIAEKLRKQGIRPEDLNVQTTSELGRVFSVDPYPQMVPTVSLSSEVVSDSVSSLLPEQDQIQSQQHQK